MEEITSGFVEGAKLAVEEWPRRYGTGELLAEGIGRVGERELRNPKGWLQSFAMGYESFWASLDNWRESQKALLSNRGK